MTLIPAQIRQVPIKAITILNPRVRNKRIFNELVTSIEHLGLKRPITVSARPDQSGYDPKADLRALEELWLDKLSPFDERGYNVVPKRAA